MSAPRIPAPSEVRRILVVKLSSLGDLFHALPTVRMLKAATGAAVDWVVQPEYADLVRCFRDVDRVIEFPRRNLLGRGVAFLRELRRERYDLIADLQGLMKSAIPARLARGGLRVGPSFRREGTDLFYSAVAGPRNKDRHAVDENLDLIRWLDWPGMAVRFPVVFPAYPLPGAAPRVAIVPASRWMTKNWPVANFAEVARSLLDCGATVILVGGAGEAEACAAIEKPLYDSPRLHNLCGRTSLVELGGLLAGMDLVITVDSGPMHMAAALGVPVLAIFGPTDPRRTGPYGDRTRVLGVEELDCHPCFADFCERGDLACMRQLGPSQVLAAARAMLEGPGPLGEGGDSP